MGLVKLPLMLGSRPSPCQYDLLHCCTAALLHPLWEISESPFKKLSFFLLVGTQLLTAL